MRLVSGPLLYLKQIFYQSRDTNHFRYCQKIRKSVPTHSKSLKSDLYKKVDKAERIVEIGQLFCQTFAYNFVDYVLQKSILSE